VMMFQVIDGIFRASRRQNREMESVATGRRALDVMTIDLQNAPVCWEYHAHGPHFAGEQPLCHAVNPPG